MDRLLFLLHFFSLLLLLLARWLLLNLYFFEALNLLLFNKIAYDALECDDEKGAIHEVHASSEEHTFRPLVRFRCRR